MVVVIDNYDSFTYNLVQYFREIGQMVQVMKNDCGSLADIDALRPSMILLSPGPGTPNDAGMSLDVFAAFAQRCPILGVCLGHQIIGQALGAKVVPAPQLRHGKVVGICHDRLGMFADIPVARFKVTCYNSLTLQHSSLPDCLHLSAWVDGNAPLGNTPLDKNNRFDDAAEVIGADVIGTEVIGTEVIGAEVMGIRHTVLPIEGVQFHPESILSEHGHRLLQGFVDRYVC